MIQIIKARRQTETFMMDYRQTSIQARARNEIRCTKFPRRFFEADRQQVVGTNEVRSETFERKQKAESSRQAQKTAKACIQLERKKSLNESARAENALKE